MNGTDTLVVNEVFGATIQGEGPAAGRPCGFVRLMGCNLTCTWCDTKQTWDAAHYDLRKEGTRMHPEDIVEKVEAMRVRLVVFSGGEPLLQQNYRGFHQMLRGFRTAGISVHVETNGTVLPSDRTLGCVDQFVVSPKISNAGVPLSRTLKEPVLKVLRDHNAHFKFVCRTPGDVAETAIVVKRNNIPPRRVWIMPEGVDTSSICDHLRQITEPAVERGYNVSSRLHVLVWGNERGR